ncbi:glycoside hydrolase family 38 C-terminal domain-containing protein [Saccharothrix sp.]|uniref:glycoside hydrolase family 38 N-terminal domain-containing protein n=1 Tax=Saccharothrix sp. TaxID=1873460 RepID=UPI002811AE93|nr:glycoside hydrolase family 38 C-terminal domain-containing protein [Saccharothrix sp.]
MAARILSVVSTDLFIGTEDQPRQVVRVTVDRGSGSAALPVEVAGPGLTGSATVDAGEGEVVVEVPIEVSVAPRTEIPVTASLGSSTVDGVVTVEETGWRMFLVSHFHYDPVWWNTQAAYTQTWELQGNDGTTRPVWEHNGFNLVRAHLDMALADPDYAFVLAEVDYLKPFWDVHPEYRQVLRDLIAEGRVEVMGGTYNEPNTNLTGSETTIRNLVYGVGYQRSIMGADPRTAWQLDVFGHDPQFPGLVAEAGLTSTSWARGPFHQWGPLLTKFNEAGGDAANMQFPAEFEWISPSGRGVLTHYMPNHYSAGWWMDSSATLEEACGKVYDLFRAVKPAAATRNTLLPVGTDYTPPNKWVTLIHREWASRYVWPKFVCGTPRDFFAAVHSELTARGVAPSPQTRDMNPVYTGKDVSYIDTKQAQRAAEVAATDAEKLAVFASALGLGEYPEAALDKVWRQLAYGAHHDAITGSESDQVYIDLVSGWREAHDLAVDVRERSLAAILGQVDTSGVGRAVTVVNTLAFARTDVVRVTVPGSSGLRLLDASGVAVPFVAEAVGESTVIAFVASDVPGMGWRTWRLEASDSALPTWEAGSGVAIFNEYFAVEADPARGGGLRSIREVVSGRELVRAGEVANELRLYDEYPQHPEFGEGPWHLLPNGSVVSSASSPAEVRVSHSPVGSRLSVFGRVGDVSFEQRITLWHGVDRLDLRTRVPEFSGSDQLLRVKFPVDVPGARPVSEVGGAVIARGFALPDSDTAVAPWTLDNPANTFFGLSSTAALRLVSPAGAVLGRAAIAVAEVVVPALVDAAPLARELVVALARVGVTATTSTAEGARYGWLRVDSNLPDVRIVLGGPERNPIAAEVLSTRDEWRAELKRQLAERGAARVFVPALSAVEEAWRPNADLRSLRSLPVVVVDGVDAGALAAEIAALADEFAVGDAEVTAVEVGPTRLLDDHTVGLLSYGIPGFAVDPSGALHLSLMRSCTGWPSGIWLDPPMRRAPDGSAFQLQHWTHDFDYALVSGAGDWRSADLVARGQGFSAPLHGRVIEPHSGVMPAEFALLSVSPERRVQVQTVKRAGNPSAVGSVERPGGMTVRLVETTGRPVTATVSSVVPWAGAYTADLLEEERREPVLVEGKVVVALDGSQIATIVTDPAPTAPAGTTTAGRVAASGAAPGGTAGSGTTAGGAAAGEVAATGTAAGGAAAGPAAAGEVGADRFGGSAAGGVLGASAAGGVLGASAEVAQPVYARYWLHNRGPAPMGFFPVSVTAGPTVLTAGDGPLSTSVTVASQVAAEFSGTLRVVVPEGWSATPAERPITLGAGGHTSFPVEVVPTGGPGLYFVRVQVPVGEDLVEDVVSVLVPGGPLDEVVPPPPGPEIDHGKQIEGTTATSGRVTGLRVTDVSESVVVRPGERSVVAVTLANDSSSTVDGEAMPVSPWGTWGFVGPYAKGFSVPAGGVGRVEFEVDVPVDVEPGAWWVMVKLMWFGRVQYTPAIPVEVR